VFSPLKQLFSKSQRNEENAPAPRAEVKKQYNFPEIPVRTTAQSIFREKMQYAAEDRYSNTPSGEFPMVVLDES